MGRIRYYNRDPLAALDGMMELTLEERGAYNTILDLIYAREGKLDDDSRFIAGWLRCDVRVWKRIRTRLLELGKLYLEDGTLRNSRADAEVNRALGRIASASDAGKTSATKKADVRSKNKDIASTPVERPSQPLSLSLEKKDSVAKATGADAPSPVPIANETPEAKLWRLGLPDLMALGLTEARARPLIGSWRRDTGDDCERVLGAIMRAREYAVANPIAWITASLKPRNNDGKSVHAAIRRLREHNPFDEPAPGGVCLDAGGNPIRLLSQG